MAARGALTRFVRPLVLRSTSRSIAGASRDLSPSVLSSAPAAPCSFASPTRREDLYPFADSLRSFCASAAETSSKVVVVKDDADFQRSFSQVQSSGFLGVVYFTAQWCGPCRQIAPFIEQLSQDFEDVTFIKVDCDNIHLERTMVDAKIGVVPTFRFHKGGKLIGELTGAEMEKLKSLVTNLRANK